MSKHTPGPWFRDRTTVYALNARNCNRFCAQVQDAHTPAYELEANASLIAAAPELLEALEMAVAEYEKLPHSLGYEFTHLPAMRAAIARAKGEQA